MYTSVSLLAVLLVGLTASGSAASRQWQTIKPGAVTRCAHNTSYAFFFRPGAPGNTNLVVETEGGGACWDTLTCTLGSFKSTVDVESTLQGLDRGVHNTGDKRNPFRDWNHLFIPYCTADAHGGNHTNTYSDSVTIHHVGRANVAAALDWLGSHFDANPQVVAAIGCSAGSLGAIITAPKVFAMYPKARPLYWGDSYVGVISNKQFADGLHAWDLAFDDSIQALDRSHLEAVAANKSASAGYYIVSQTIGAARDAQFASYTSNADVVQTSFYALGGGSGWTKAMRTLVSRLHTAFPKQYATFIASGDAHCRSQTSKFFDVVSDGVELASWVSSVVAGSLPSDQRAVDCGSKC